MKKDDISHLLQRYLSAHAERREPYFDADEICDLLDSFEESEDFTYYDEVLALGLKLHPGNTDLQIKQCRLYVYNEDFDGALALIDSIADTDNQDLDMLRLECYSSLEQYDKVIEFTEELIEHNCDYLESIFEYIVPILNDLELQNEARDFIDRGLAMYPGNLILKDELCYNLESEGNIPEAIKVCDELIDKNPYSYDYWFTLGRLYSMNAEYDKAIEAFDFALTCDDSEIELKILKGYCLCMNESFEKAIEVYSEIANEDNEIFSRVRPLMAECYIKLENFEKAYDLLKDLLASTEPIYEPNTYVNFIRCCVETSRPREATEAMYKACKLFPENTRILSLMALASLDRGDEKEAIRITDLLFEVLDKQSNVASEDTDNLFYAGQYLYLRGDLEKALKYYKKIIEIDPNKPFMHIHLAMVYLSLGDMEHFGEHFQQTNPKEMLDYLTKSGIDVSKLNQQLQYPSGHIPPEELAREFLKNKDNSN